VIAAGFRLSQKTAPPQVDGHLCAEQLDPLRCPAAPSPGRANLGWLFKAIGKFLTSAKTAV